MNQQKTLQDYECACQEAATDTQREQLALEALNFLIDTLAMPGKIAAEVALAFEQERISPGAPPALPDAPGELDDVLCAQLEARLADFLPHIARLRESRSPATVLLLFARAAEIGRKIDAWHKYAYWAELFDFLKNAAPEQWRQWRGAVIAQQKARAEIGNGEFKTALAFAVYGLRSLAGIPDRRAYLDLCSRAQNALAEGEACFKLAQALGLWVIKESLAAGHHLRAAGMRHNLGNQLVLAGENSAAITVLEEAQKLSEQCWPVRDMNYFQVNVLERLARAYLNAGETQKAAEYLERYGAHAFQPREQTLLCLGKGYLALHAGDFEAAEQEFVAACQHAQCQVGGACNDFSNLWSAYASLALLCLKYQQPDRALEYLDKCCKHGDSKAEYRNSDRKIHEFFLEAEARHQKSDLPAGRQKLKEAEELVGKHASPRRKMQLLFTQSLYENDAAKREEAINLAMAHGFRAPDPDLIRVAVFS